MRRARPAAGALSPDRARPTAPSDRHPGRIPPAGRPAPDRTGVSAGPVRTHDSLGTAGWRVVHGSRVPVSFHRARRDPAESVGSAGSAGGPPATHHNPRNTICRHTHLWNVTESAVSINAFSHADAAEPSFAADAQARSTVSAYSRQSVVHQYSTMHVPHSWRTPHDAIHPKDPTA